MDKINAQNFSRHLSHFHGQPWFLHARQAVAKTLLRHWTLTIFLIAAPFVIIPWLWLGVNINKSLNTAESSVKDKNNLSFVSAENVKTDDTLFKVIPTAPVSIKSNVLVNDTTPKLKLAQDLKFSENILFYTGRVSLGIKGREHIKRLTQGLPVKAELELYGYAGKQKEESVFSREFIALGRATAVRDVIRKEGFKGKMTIIHPKFYLEKTKLSVDPRKVEVTVILASDQN